MYLDTGVTHRVATGKEISVFDHLRAASKFLVLAASTKGVFFWHLLWYFLKHPTSILIIFLEESVWVLWYFLL